MPPVDNWTFLLIVAGLTQDQQFILLVLSLLGTFIIIITILIYIHRLFSTYSAIVKEVLEWNKKFGKPIKFSYSWLQGVVISVQVENACVVNEGAKSKERVVSCVNEHKIVNVNEKQNMLEGAKSIGAGAAVGIGKSKKENFLTRGTARILPSSPCFNFIPRSFFCSSPENSEMLTNKKSFLKIKNEKLIEFLDKRFYLIAGILILFILLFLRICL